MANKCGVYYRRRGICIIGYGNIGLRLIRGEGRLRIRCRIIMERRF